MRRCPPISIHALREEGDTISSFPLSFLRYFYPRPPRGGRRFIWLNGIKIDKFLSTPSARRATFFRPVICVILAISIHALREEGDGTFPRCLSTLSYFYPRPPRGGRPFEILAVSLHLVISIHALREEGDPSPRFARGGARDFYPRPPRGGRRLGTSGRNQGRDFYPRPPRGGRQGLLYKLSAFSFISIHALREEGDPALAAHFSKLMPFLSTPSARRATA